MPMSRRSNRNDAELYEAERRHRGGARRQSITQSFVARAPPQRPVRCSPSGSNQKTFARSEPGLRRVFRLIERLTRSPTASFDGQSDRRNLAHGWLPFLGGSESRGARSEK